MVQSSGWNLIARSGHEEGDIVIIILCDGISFRSAMTRNSDS